MSNSYVLAGDVGGTNLRIAAVSHDGSILHQVNEPTPKTGVADVIATIGRLAEECISANDGGGRPASFGLALAALVNFRDGRILSSPNLPELNDQPLSQQLSERLRLNVLIENDATAAAIGEYWLGSSQGAESSVFVTL